jgi:hypothetical protein
MARPGRSALPVPNIDGNGDQLGEGEVALVGQRLDAFGFGRIDTERLQTGGVDGEARRDPPQGEHDRAAAFYDLVVECTERTRAICPNYNDMRLLERAAGIAAAAGRCWDDAEEHFRTTLRQAAGLPHLPEQAHTRRFLARMLLERDGPGDRAEAAQMAAEAADLYRRMGIPRHFELAAGLLNAS